jgi:hypothetical protein
LLHQACANAAGAEALGKKQVWKRNGLQTITINNWASKIKKKWASTNDGERCAHRA